VKSTNAEISRRGAEAQRDLVALDSRPSTLDPPFTWKATPAALALLRRPDILAIEEDPDVIEEITLLSQPKTRTAAMALYGIYYNRQRCIRAVSDAVGFWQCGHPNGKGKHGLYCGRHA
jgi:hypothetical protein